MTPYYEQSGITIYHGDCREIAPSLSDEHGIVVITDPPYGQTSLDWDQWPDGWLQRVPAACLWCFGTLRMFMEHERDFRLGGWKLAQDVIWEKHNGSSFHADRFKRVHEQPAQFYRGEWSGVYKSPQFTNDATARATRRKHRPSHTGHIEASTYVSTDGGPRMARSVIRIKSCHGYAENETQKPVGILEPLVAYSVPIDHVVLDLFGGSGSTAVAAKAMGRRATLIEIREDQCEIAAKRLQQEALPLEVA